MTSNSDHLTLTVFNDQKILEKLITTHLQHSFNPALENLNKLTKKSIRDISTENPYIGHVLKTPKGAFIHGQDLNRTHTQHQLKALNFSSYRLYRGGSCTAQRASRGPGRRPETELTQFQTRISTGSRTAV